MADNTSQVGSDTIATDDVTTLNGAASSGVKVQRVKVAYGDDGTARDVSSTFGLPVRQQQDIGRQAVSLLVDNIVGIAAEALVSYGGFNNGAALTAGTNAFVVPAGRVFRITSAALSVTGTAIAQARVRLRAASATAVLASPHYLGLSVGHAANGGGHMDICPDGGIEIPAGFAVGISMVGATSQTYTVSVQGFTYVP